MSELEMPVLIALFILAGSVAGYMAGLLGIGGGASPTANTQKTCHIPSYRTCKNKKGNEDWHFQFRHIYNLLSATFISVSQLIYIITGVMSSLDCLAHILKRLR